MQENNKKPTGHSKTLAIVLIIVAILALVIVGVVAAATLTAKTVPGSGKITVPTSPTPTTTTTVTSTTTATTSGAPAEPAYTLSSDVNGTNLLTATSDIDFSCIATDYSGAFSQAVTVYIENTGTNGTGSYAGSLATINSLPVRINVIASACPVGRALKVGDVPATSAPTTSGVP